MIIQSLAVPRRAPWDITFVMNPTPRWFALVFLAVGCLVLLTLVFDIWSTRRFVSNATRADGVVIELNAGTAHPQVEFSLPSGEKVSFPANGFISYGMGKHAKVLYLPDDPYTSARLDDFGDLWTGKILQAVLGFVFLVVGVFKLFVP